MEVEVRLTDLYFFQPLLAWDEIIAAAALVLTERAASPFRFRTEVREVPGFEDDSLEMTILDVGLDAGELVKRKRTFERSHFVELAAIALAGLVLYHAGSHAIWNVAMRSSGADYEVDDARYLLEVTGRSRRRHFETAWHQHWQRLQECAGGSFYLFAAEFQTLSGRLAFQP